MVCGHGNTRRFVAARVSDKWRGLTSGSIFEVKQEVGANAINPFLVDMRAGVGLILENDDGDMDRVGVDLRARRDGVVSGLQAGDRRNDNIEGNCPRGGIILGGRRFQIVACSKLKDFSEFKATVGDYSMIFFLVGVQVLQKCFGFR